MEYVVLGVCAVTVVLGVVAFLSPATFAQVLGILDTPIGMWAASGMRILFGIALYVAAPTSSAPDVLRILGIVLVAVGLLTLSTLTVRSASPRRNGRNRSSDLPALDARPGQESPMR